MRILTANGEFNLPVDFAAELSLYNIMLTDTGNQTLPVTLPPSPNNLRLIGYSHRIDSTFKPLKDIPVVVQEGISSSSANMGINSVDNEEGISCTLYLGTGEFYSLINKRMLQSLSWPEIKSPAYSTESLSQRVLYLVNLLKGEYLTPTPDCNFKIAPLATDKKVTEKRNTTNYTGLLILNAFENDTSNTLNFNGTTEDYLDKFKGERYQIFVEDGANITCTYGYGMTPFLKLKFVIEFIFSEFGYAVDTFNLEYEMTNYATDICIENNIVDAIYTGILKFKQIVPDVTVKEFIEYFEKCFLGKFIVDETSKTAVFKLMEYQLQIPPDMDLTPYLSGKLKPGQPEFKELILKLSSDTRNYESSNESEVFEFDLHDSQHVIERYYINVSPFSAEATLSLIQCSGILHKNSNLVIGGKITSEDSETNKRIDFISIPDEFTSTEMLNQYTVYYRNTRTLDGIINGKGYNVLEVIKWFYEQYKEFRLNSNIPFEVKMNIPKYILHNLDITTPKLMSDQKVLIESISYNIGSQTTEELQTITIRTLRSYADQT